MGDLTNNFSRKEFACKCGCGFKTVDFELIQVLEIVRSKFKKSVKINSACRCEEYNKSVGGSDKSKHKLGIAADIVVEGVNPKDVYNYLNQLFKGKYGMGKYDSFTHIDVRSNKARW